jgi:hypothetical protein
MQELLMLPRLNEDVLAKFEVEARATGSEKEQRQLVKRLLQGSGGPPFPLQEGG